MKRHKFYYKFLVPLTTLFCRIKFGYTYEKAKDLPENYIVLSNHLTDYDMLFVGASFSRQMYFVGSEHIARWKFLYKIIQYAFAPIMRYKGSVASSTVLDILRKVKKGENVCIFAEGVRSWDGRSSPILPSTGKMVKKAGCGLVTYKIVGGYFASPMWSSSNTRRGYVHGAPVNVYTAEQLKAMSVDEINEAIRRDLWEDAYARQLADPKPYRGKRLAENMETLLFLCPECGRMETMHSQNDTVTCEACGYSFRLDEYGMLSDERFPTVQALSDWQKEQVALHVEQGLAYTTDFAELITVENHIETPLTTGPLYMDGNILRCGEQEFSMDTVSELAMHGRQAIVFTAGKDYYELLPKKGTNSLKYMLYYLAQKAHTTTVIES